MLDIIFGGGRVVFLIVMGIGFLGQYVEWQLLSVLRACLEVQKLGLSFERERRLVVVRCRRRHLWLIVAQFGESPRHQRRWVSLQLRRFAFMAVDCALALSQVVVENFKVFIEEV